MSEARYCPVCKGARYGKFCLRCGGLTVEAMFKCPHCNEEISVVSKFCTECGKPIHEAVVKHIAAQMQSRKEKDISVSSGIAGPEAAR